MLSPEFNLELINGNWGIAAFSLMMICAAYLRHEVRARHILPFGERRRLTDGIKVAIATFAMSLGIFVRSLETWRWRIFGGELDQFWLTVGGIVAIIGFLCLIREKSIMLFGRRPWLITLWAMVVFTVASIAHRAYQ